MATTPNAQLTKLAIGIASVAAIAGITGRLAVGSPASKAAAADTGIQQQNSPFAAQPGTIAPPAPLPGEGVGTWPGQSQGEGMNTWSGWGGDDDAYEGGESEHEGREHGGGSFFSVPGFGGQQSQLQQAPRTRSRHS